MILWAKVTTRFSGLHRYPNAPKNVAFLSNLHRHVFHVTLWVEQFHDDRDIEYLTVKEWLEDLTRILPKEETASCELMARQIHHSALIEYSDRSRRRLKVEVTEDGENGALIEDP